MKDSNIYILLWQKYKAAILSIMRRSIESSCEYQLSKHEFEAVGERQKAGYTFNLEIEKGIVTNNIDGTAVARDLVAVLKSSNTVIELMKEYNFKINLTKDFILRIQTYK